MEATLNPSAAANNNGIMRPNQRVDGRQNEHSTALIGAKTHDLVRLAQSVAVPSARAKPETRAGTDVDGRKEHKKNSSGRCKRCERL